MTENIPTIPGPMLDFKDQVTFGTITSRKEVVITPRYGGDFKAGQILRMEIPAQDYVDPSHIYMSFKTRLYAGAGNNWVSSSLTTPLNPTSGIPYLDENRVLSTSANCMKTVRFQPGIQCIFNRIKVLAGSTTIEDIQDYNDLYRFMLEATTSPEWRNSDGAEQEGFYDPENFKQMITVANHHSVEEPITYSKLDYDSHPHVYTIRPMLGVLELGKLWPTKYMGNITLEFYLAENADCLWSTSSARMTETVYAPPATGERTRPLKIEVPAVTTSSGGNHAITLSVNSVPSIHHPTVVTETLPWASYTGVQSAVNTSQGFVTTDFPNAYYQISDVELHVPFITVLEDFDRAMFSKIENGGLDLHFSTFHEHVRQITSTGRQNITFTERSLSVKGGFLVMKNSDDIRDIRIDTSFRGNNMEWYQWKIGNEYIPAQKVDCHEGGARPLAQLKMALHTFNDFGGANNIKDVDYMPKHVAGDVNSWDKNELLRGTSQPSKFAVGLSLEKSPGQMSGFDSAAAGVDIEFQMNLRDNSVRFPSPYNAVQMFNGNLGAKTFQPTKYKVHFCGDNDNVTATNTITTVVEDYSSEEGGVYHAGGYTSSRLANRPGGFMASKSLTLTGGLHTTVTMSAAGSVVTVLPTYTSVAETGKYVRVEFFAQVDSLLRIRRVGQLEVVV